MTTSRRVLNAVPRIGFFPQVVSQGGKPWPEDIIFPSAMRAAMESLGHSDFDYIHFVGVTGAGFFLNWKDGWHQDNQAIYYMVPIDEHLKLFEQAFDSAGYAMQLHRLHGQDAISPEQARQCVIASIDAGRPVIAHGVVGPPEPSLICGYDDAGHTLIGWSCFQDMPPFTTGLEFEPNGMFRKRDWLADTFDLFVFGPRRQHSTPHDIRLQSLRWAVKVARTAETWGGRHNGLAAFDAWADHLLRDEDITPDGAVPPGADARPFDIHENAVGHLAEARWYVSKYLARLAGEEPKLASLLYEAAACCAREHDLMWQVWGCIGGNQRSPENVRRFADPAARRRIIELIREARRQDERAIERIETALAST